MFITISNGRVREESPTHTHKTKHDPVALRVMCRELV